MTLKSSPLVWSLAFMVVAFLALTKGAPTTKEEEEIQDHPYSFLIHHPSESGSIIYYYYCTILTSLKIRTLC